MNEFLIVAATNREGDEERGLELDAGWSRDYYETFPGTLRTLKRSPDDDDDQRQTTKAPSSTRNGESNGKK